MTREFTVIPLPKARIAQAYPLIQASSPGLSLDCWQRFAERLVEPPQKERGALIVQNEGGIIVGLVIYNTAFDLHHGPIMVVEHLLAFELLDRKLVIGLLSEKLEEIAALNGYGAIHTHLPAKGVETGSHWLHHLLVARGHRAESLAFCKPLAGPAPASIA